MDYSAILIDINEVDKLPSEFKPYVYFKARLEKRELTGNEKVALFNIATTTAYVPIFLDTGKTLKDIEEEISNDWNANINPESRERLRRFLE